MSQQSNFIDCLIIAVDSHMRGETPHVQIIPKGHETDFTHALRLFGAEALKAHADPLKQTELHIRHARIDKRVRVESVAAYIAQQRPWLSSATNELLVLEAKPITVYELESWDKQPMPAGNPFEPAEVYDDNTVEPDSPGVTIAEAREQVAAARGSEGPTIAEARAAVAARGSEGPTIAERRAEVNEQRDADVEFDDEEGLTIAERRAEVNEQRDQAGYASPADDDWEDDEEEDEYEGSY